MSIQSIKRSMRLDFVVAAVLGGLWALAFGIGGRFGIDKLMDFSFIPLVGALACLFAIRVRYDLLNHVRETEPEEEPEEGP